MARKNAALFYAQRAAREIVAEQTRARLIMGYDTAILAAHDVFKMGPGRAAAFCEAYNRRMDELASLYIADTDENHDERLEYAKAKRDEAIRTIVGEENFVPFNEAYGEAYMDELKRFRVMSGQCQET